jgi:hypothetical protein
MPTRSRTSKKTNAVNSVLSMATRTVSRSQTSELEFAAIAPAVARHASTRFLSISITTLADRKPRRHDLASH